MENKIKLSICIPTHNRFSHLKKILENLVAQTEKLQNQVEICVSDNASTDGTKDLLKNYEDYRNVHYLANRNNYGYDYNVVNVINMACKGEYIWLLSDDDDLSEDAIEFVLNIISENPGCNAIFVKPIFFRGGIVKKGAKEVVGYKAISSPKDALHEIGWHISFISSHIIANRPENLCYNNYMGLGFMHMPFVLDHIKDGYVISVDKGLLYSLQGNSGGYKYTVNPQYRASFFAP